MSTAVLRRRWLRPLPRQVRPVQNETTVSFVRRLARANHIRPEVLISYLDAWMSWGGLDITISPQNLADAAGTDVRHLLGALPLLDVEAEPAVVWPDGIPSPHRESAEMRLACRRCMAAKGIFTAVTVLAWTDKNLCVRHQLWTGHGVTVIEDQADIASIPEIGQAQARLSHLSRRRGPSYIRGSYYDAETVIDWSSRESSSQTAGQERLRHFLAGSATGALPRSYDYASCFPEVVGVLSVLTSPYWQRMAGSAAVGDTLRLYRRFAASGITWEDPNQNIPLRDWIRSAQRGVIRMPWAESARRIGATPEPLRARR